MRKVLITLLLSVVMLDAGCTRSVTVQSPIAVSPSDQREQNYLKAAKAANDFSIGLAALVDSEISFHKANAISNAEHRKLQLIFKKTTQAAKILNAAIGTAYANPGTASALLTAFAATDELLVQGVVPIGNSTAKTSLTAGITALRIVLAAVSTNIQQPVPPTPKIQ